MSPHSKCQYHKRQGKGRKSHKSGESKETQHHKQHKTLNWILEKKKNIRAKDWLNLKKDCI